jgi:hypothetical protein
VVVVVHYMAKSLNVQSEMACSAKKLSIIPLDSVQVYDKCTCSIATSTARNAGSCCNDYALHTVTVDDDYRNVTDTY